MAHLVTGYAGYAHIQSADQGSYNAAFFGGGQYVMESGNRFEASILDNNTVRVLDGDLLMYGRHVRIEPDTYEDMTIDTGIAGQKRIDLICMTYEKNTTDGTERAFLEVVKGIGTEGTVKVPDYTDGNILNGAVKNQLPLYQVNIDGVVLANITPLFTTIPTYKTLAERYAAQFEATINALKAADILDTIEEIDANTQGNMFAGALALKAHLLDENNPHKLSKGDVGLGSVPNKKTNDQTPTYSEITDITNPVELVSGETLATAFRKIAFAIKCLIAHLANKKNPHGVSKADIELNNVDNTADSEKTVKSAGECTGNAATATKLATPRAFRVHLGSMDVANFDGSANATPGVIGTLGVGNGGTGVTTLPNLRKELVVFKTTTVKVTIPANAQVNVEITPPTQEGFTFYPMQFYVATVANITVLSMGEDSLRVWNNSTSEKSPSYTIRWIGIRT